MAEKIINMGIYHRQHFLQVLRTEDFLFDFAKGKELFTDQFSQLFTELLLFGRKNALETEAQKLYRVFWVEKHFDGHPVGEPTDKRRNKRNTQQPDTHMDTIWTCKETDNSSFARYCSESHSFPGWRS